MEKLIKIDDYSRVRDICGIEDKNLRFIEKELKVTIALRADGILVKGESKRIEKALHFITKMMDLAREGMVFSQTELSQYLNAVHLSGDEGVRQDEDSQGIRVFSTRKRLVLPKTQGQQDYIKAIRKHDVIFSIGPAGTGKTYLAMALAVNFLMRKNVGRIILTRPAIEAGESLGFLPGDMAEKMGPYLRPLYDALYDMMEAEMIEEFIETGVIEVAPLAYMRGRTLNNAFVILDEAQNCTTEQLKMFITRLGFDSKAVITGDITQSDLPGGKPVGLLEGVEILKAIEDIKFVYLGRNDVVRNPLIQKIIQAYENFYREKAN
ncbi:MAG: PhoH family protein [Candidatus Omnitrophota bacterium]